MANKTVLIVDDDLSLCDNLKDILQDKGYEPFFAGTCHDGLKMTRERRAKVALLDLKLPDGQGTTLLSDIKAINPDCICIIMTAYADLDSAVAALEKAAYHYLQKPVHPLELFRILEGAFETIQLREQKHQAEEALKESEYRYRDLFENANDLIQSVDKDGRIIYVNQKWLETLEYSKNEISELNFWNILRKDQIPHCKGLFEGLLRGESFNRVEVVFISKTGKEIYVEGNANVQLKDGQFISTRGIFRDIRVRKHAEEALKKSETKYRELVQNANSIILRMDTQGKVTFFNEFAQSYFGFTEDEILGKSVVGTIFSESNSAGQDLKAMIQDIGIHPEKYATNENENMRRNHERVWVSWTNKAIRDENGNILEILCIGNDITARKRLETQLQQSQKLEAIGTLAGGIAHDFNNILAGIMGYIEIAYYDLPEHNQSRQNLDKALKASHRAKDLIKQILALSRKSEQEQKPIQTHLVIKEALKLLRASLPSTIEISQDVSTDSDTILGDPTQIHQVLMNLCTNAHHAMGDKGGVLKVTLRNVEFGLRPGGAFAPKGIRNLDLKIDKNQSKIRNMKFAMEHPDLQPGPYVELTVRDTGHGIDSATIARIYDPYFTTKEIDVGTGLGLSVVHGIVKSHGGSIAVSSEPGKGTTFNILFPRLEVGAEDEAKPHKVLSYGHERILFVDDEEDLVEIGKQMLEHLGYEFVAGTNSIEALEVFRAQPDKFDLVITDQTMPKMAGAELAKELMRIRPDIPIILCTGYSEVISKDKAKAIGIQEFLMKPLYIHDLAKAIRKVLDK